MVGRTVDAGFALGAPRGVAGLAGAPVKDLLADSFAHLWGSEGGDMVAGAAGVWVSDTGRCCG